MLTGPLNADASTLFIGKILNKFPPEIQAQFATIHPADPKLPFNSGSGGGEPTVAAFYAILFKMAPAEIGAVIAAAFPPVVTVVHGGTEPSNQQFMRETIATLSAMQAGSIAAHAAVAGEHACNCTTGNSTGYNNHALTHRPPRRQRIGRRREQGPLDEDRSLPCLHRQAGLPGNL